MGAVVSGNDWGCGVTLEEIRERDEAEAVRANQAHAFKSELAQLINRHSMENRSDTPDFILADYLFRCLEAFEVTKQAAYLWQGK